MFGFIGGNPDSTPVPFNLAPSGALRVIPGFVGIEEALYNEEELEPDEELIVLQHLAVANATFHALCISGSGDADGIYTILKNGTPIAKKRTSWADRNVDFDYQYGFTFQAGDSLEVSIKNLGDANSLFNASIYGEIIN